MLKHQGADQDCDTDEENLEYGRSQLLDELRSAISEYQKDHKAIE